MQKRNQSACIYIVINLQLMLKMLFDGLLEASSLYYGDAVGLAPISMASSKTKNTNLSKSFWEEDCKEHPTRIACLNYDS